MPSSWEAGLILGEWKEKSGMLTWGVGAAITLEVPRTAAANATAAVENRIFMIIWTTGHEGQY